VPPSPVLRHRRADSPNRTLDLQQSRKWGIYGIINLLFKTYFRLNSISLSRNVLKALHAYKGDMPPFDRFPPPQRVTFKYYEGVLSFLEENYVEVLFRFESNYYE
jgi:hypothetical protein